MVAPLVLRIPSSQLHPEDVAPVQLASSRSAQNDSIKRCFEQLLHTTVSADRWDIASMVMGGLGLRSAHRGRQVSFWSSWADVLHMVRLRHLEMAATMLRGLRRPEGFPDFEDVGPRHRSWQREATQEANNFFMNTAVWPRLSPAARALLRWSSRWTSIFLLPHVATHLLRATSVALVSAPLPAPASHSANLLCGRLLDSLGHHRERAPQWECWAVGDSLWSLLQHAFAERLAVVSRSTHSSETWTLWLQTLPTTDDLKWSQMVSRCSTEHNWPSTPRGVSSREGWGATPPVRRLQWCCFVGSSAPETTSAP